MMRRFTCALTIFFTVAASLHGQALPGTQPLEIKGDLARVMLDGIDRYLSRELTASVEKRKQYWKPDYSSHDAYEKSVAPNRERLKKILGVIDQRVPPGMEYVSSKEMPSLVADGKYFKVHAVRWSVLPGVFGEGLLLEPKPDARPLVRGAVESRGWVIAIPDADQTPEMLVGVMPGVAPDKQFARHLAAQGFRVLVPTLIDREDTWSGSTVLKRFTNQTHREFVYRMSYEMGRHIIGYEVQKVLAAVDWCTRQKDQPPVGVFGYGEGGLLALYSAALDPRIKTTVVSGYFGPREQLHAEPIYRNVWGLLREFGDAEIARLITPRTLIVEPSSFQTGDPPAARAGRSGAAPGTFTAPASSKGVLKLVRTTFSELNDKKFAHDGPRVVAGSPPDPWDTISTFWESLEPTPTAKVVIRKAALQQEHHTLFEPGPRQKRQFDQLVDYTQKLMPDAVQRRREFVWNKLDTSSIEKFKKSQEPLRQYFHEHIIGKLPEPTMPLNPRSRLLYDTPKYKAYEVVLDVYEDVISYGILCVPTDLKPGERRPVVVCQHGLEGRPTDVVSPDKKTPYYNSFGSQLADKGFIVFAPQNPYIFKNDFRQVVRKANPLELSLYSFIVRQHQRILEFLGALPFVDATKIAYYGLSYGGKVAMRIPAILEGYCLSICSGDFNEWIWKNINLEWQGSYMFTGEYEMYEFDLGNTFNYAEMAALIAPRPFMVERGHNDGVGLDEYVAFEYAKVRRLYAQLGSADRTEIEFFTGGHECRVVGTLAFLQKHLQWPPR